MNSPFVNAMKYNCSILFGLRSTPQKEKDDCESPALDDMNTYRFESSEPESEPNSESGSGPQSEPESEPDSELQSESELESEKDSENESGSESESVDSDSGLQTDDEKSSGHPSK